MSDHGRPGRTLWLHRVGLDNVATSRILVNPAVILILRYIVSSIFRADNPPMLFLPAMTSERTILVRMLVFQDEPLNDTPISQLPCVR